MARLAAEARGTARPLRAAALSPCAPCPHLAHTKPPRAHRGFSNNYDKVYHDDSICGGLFIALPLYPRRFCNPTSAQCQLVLWHGVSTRKRCQTHTSDEPKLRAEDFTARNSVPCVPLLSSKWSTSRFYLQDKSVPKLNGPIKSPLQFWFAAQPGNERQGWKVEGGQTCHTRQVQEK